MRRLSNARHLSDRSREAVLSAPGVASSFAMTLQHRTFLVTGANSGIGRALVEALAARGARLVLACRSEERTLPVLIHCAADIPGSTSPFFTSTSRSFPRFVLPRRPFSLRTTRSTSWLTTRVSPAREALDERRLRFDICHEHIGPFLLTNLLLPRLRESGEARIVNVASVAHMRVKEIDWSVLDRRTVATRNGFVAYSVTKLMNILHAKALAHRLAGTSVTTSSLHPGGVASNIWRRFPRPVQWLMKLFMDSNEKGAETPLYCATAPELRNVSGRYYDRCREVRRARWRRMNVGSRAVGPNRTPADRMTRLALLSTVGLDIWIGLSGNPAWHSSGRSSFSAFFFVVTTLPALPALVATNFNGAGVPHAWMARQSYTIYLAAIGIGLPLLIVSLVGRAIR